MFLGALPGPAAVLDGRTDGRNAVESRRVRAGLCRSLGSRVFLGRPSTGFSAGRADMQVWALPSSFRNSFVAAYSSGPAWRGGH